MESKSDMSVNSMKESALIRRGQIFRCRNKGYLKKPPGYIGFCTRAGSGLLI